MTPQQIEAMKMALEALKWCHGGEPCGTAEAITAIEEALAQPEQEPVIDKSAAKRIATTLGWEPKRKPLTDVTELTNGLAMALHDAVLIRIGKDDEATRQATARIDKLVNKYKDKAAHGIKENT